MQDKMQNGNKNCKYMVVAQHGFSIGSYTLCKLADYHKVCRNFRRLFLNQNNKNYNMNKINIIPKSPSYLADATHPWKVYQ